MRVFYHPETLKIMGASTGENAMNYPSLEVQEEYYMLENLSIQEIDGELRVVYTDPTWYNSNQNTPTPDTTFTPAIPISEEEAAAMQNNSQASEEIITASGIEN